MICVFPQSPDRDFLIRFPIASTLKEHREPIRISPMPTIMLKGIGSCSNRKARIGARTGLKKKTSEAVTGDVASTAMK